MVLNWSTYIFGFFGLFAGRARDECPFAWVSRKDWGARPATSPQAMKNPVSHVVVHHSYKPPACSTTDECIKAMKWMQDLHQLENGWSDVGYNFAVGGDGKVYVGRGWSLIGAHSPSYNDKSIGICLIGDWREELPNEQQLHVAQQLIECGVSTGKISTNYTLFGHRQVRKGTECPGDRLFEELAKWEHFSRTPPNVWTPNE